MLFGPITDNRVVNYISKMDPQVQLGVGMMLLSILLIPVVVAEVRSLDRMVVTPYNPNGMQFRTFGLDERELRTFGVAGLSFVWMTLSLGGLIVATDFSF